MRYLNKKELQRLRKEIKFCSVFINDYKNSLDIDPEKACNFFDSYAEYLSELMKDGGYKDNEFFDKLKDYDNINNLYDYYCYLGFDPFN